MKRKYIVGVGAQALYTDAVTLAEIDERLRTAMLSIPGVLPDTVEFGTVERDPRLRCWQRDAYAEREVGWAVYWWYRFSWLVGSRWASFWWDHPMPFGPLGREKRAFMKTL